MGDYATFSLFWMYALMLAFAAGALAILYRAVRSGAVADDEAPKYRMMEDDEGGAPHGDIARQVRNRG